MKVRLVTLDTIDERIKQLDEFNGLFKDFDAVVKEFEAWLGVGRSVEKLSYKSERFCIRMRVACCSHPSSNTPLF